MRQQLSQPSFVNGFARSKGESVRPDLWPDYAWIPNIGYTGNVLIDIAGLQKNGAITGATSVNESGGASLKFVSNHNVNLGNILTMNFSERTIVVRFKLFSVSADQTLIDKRNEGFADNGEWSLFFDDAVSLHSGYNDRLCYVVHNGSTTSNWPWIHGSALSVNTWYTAAIVHKNGVSVVMYLNGIIDNVWSQSTNAAMTTSLSRDVKIGETSDGAKDLNGLIHSVCVYDRALTQNQIKNLSIDTILAFRCKKQVGFRVPSTPPTKIPIFMNHYRKLRAV
jgi:hypothetical protein